MTTTFIWTREDDERVEIEIEFHLSETVPATRWDPAEGGEVEIVEFTADCPPEVLNEFGDLYVKGGAFARDVDEACYAAAPSIAAMWEEGRAEWLAE